MKILGFGWFWVVFLNIFFNLDLCLEQNTSGNQPVDVGVGTRPLGRPIGEALLRRRLVHGTIYFGQERVFHKMVDVSLLINFIQFWCFDLLVVNVNLVFMFGFNMFWSSGFQSISWKGARKTVVTSDYLALMRSLESRQRWKNQRKIGIQRLDLWDFVSVFWIYCSCFGLYSFLVFHFCFKRIAVGCLFWWFLFWRWLFFWVQQVLNWNLTPGRTILQWSGVDSLQRLTDCARKPTAVKGETLQVESFGRLWWFHGTAKQVIYMVFDFVWCFLFFFLHFWWSWRFSTCWKTGWWKKTVEQWASDDSSHLHSGFSTHLGTWAWTKGSNDKLDGLCSLFWFSDVFSFSTHSICLLHPQDPCCQLGA